MFNNICFYYFVEFSTIYINAFLKMSLSLIKLNRIVFSGIFVIVFFNHTTGAETNYFDKKEMSYIKKYKSDPKTNTLFILHRSLLMIFLVLLSNKDIKATKRYKVQLY